MPGAQIGGHFVLETATGPLDTSTLDTDLMMIYFGYTYCPDVCPTELARMAQIYEGLDNDKTRVSGLFVTVDPERDTIDAVTEYAEVFDPSFKGLAGDRTQIEAVMRQYQCMRKKLATTRNLYGRSLVTHLSHGSGCEAHGAFFNGYRDPDDDRKGQNISVI